MRNGVNEKRCKKHNTKDGHICYNVYGGTETDLIRVNKIDFNVKYSATMIYKDGSEYVTGFGSTGK